MALQNIVNQWSNTYIASNIGSLLVNNIPSNLSSVLVVFSNFSGTSGTTPIFQLSTNNGSTFITSNYQSGVGYFTSGSSSTGAQSSTSGMMFTYIPAAAGFHSGSVYLCGLNASTVVTMSGTTVIQNQTSSALLMALQGVL